jgi:hypothetical protein
MIDAKLVGDFITASRSLLGLAIFWLGLTQRENALPAVVVIMLLDWTGDFVDGTIAKRSRIPRRTRVGDSDVYIDLFVSLCLGVYLISTGYVGLAFGSFYLLGWALVFWRFGLDKNLLMLMQAPIYLWFIMTTLRVLPESGLWMVVWVIIATAINWRRFSKDIVPKFISGVGSMLRGRHT